MQAKINSELLLQPSNPMMGIDELPPNIIFNILSRIPVKSLARLRCVSKLWCAYIDDPYLKIIHKAAEEPTPIIFHRNLPLLRRPRTLCFHLINNSKRETTTHHVLQLNNQPLFVFEYKLSRVEIRGSGSCNGLLYLLQEDGVLITNLFVFHPLKNQCYKLPPLPSPLCLQPSLLQESFGLGFDASTNCYKMVCVLVTTQVNQPMKLCTMVHVIGTNSWRELPQVPTSFVCGEAVFAHGCLHWLVSYLNQPRDDLRKVVCFDVIKEEFGLISSPKTQKYRTFMDQLVDLNGEVGLVCYNAGRMMEVWVLKRKEWVLHCRFKVLLSYKSTKALKVLGCWNKEGDLLMKISTENSVFRYFVYSLESGDLHGLEGCETGIFMYTNSIFSIQPNAIESNCCSKADLRKACCFGRVESIEALKLS